MQDLARDFTSGPYDMRPTRFAPTGYKVSLRFENSVKLYLCANEGNIIDQPNDEDENAFFIVSAPDITVGTTIGPFGLRDAFTSVPFRIEACHGVDAVLSLPKSNTVEEFRVKDQPLPHVLVANTIAIEGNYTYFHTAAERGLAEGSFTRGVDTFTVNVTGQGGTANVFGIYLHYILQIRNNYMGTSINYVTSEEYRAKRRDAAATAAADATDPARSTPPAPSAAAPQEVPIQTTAAVSPAVTALSPDSLMTVLDDPAPMSGADASSVTVTVATATTPAPAATSTSTASEPKPAHLRRQSTLRLLDTSVVPVTAAESLFEFHLLLNAKDLTCLLPTHMYQRQESIALHTRNIQLDVRYCSLYTGLELSVDPIVLGGEGFLGAQMGSDENLAWRGNNRIGADEQRVTVTHLKTSMNMMFGPGQLEPTYRIAVGVHVGEVLGDLSLQQVDKLASWASSFAHQVDNYDNRLDVDSLVTTNPIHEEPVVPLADTEEIDDDPSVLLLTNEEPSLMWVSLDVHVEPVRVGVVVRRPLVTTVPPTTPALSYNEVAATAFEFRLPHGLRISVDNLINERYHLKVVAHIPNLQARVLVHLVKKSSFFLQTFL